MRSVRGAPKVLRTYLRMTLGTVRCTRKAKRTLVPLSLLCSILTLTQESSVESQNVASSWVDSSPHDASARTHTFVCSNWRTSTS